MQSFGLFFTKRQTRRQFKNIKHLKLKYLCLFSIALFLATSFKPDNEIVLKYFVSKGKKHLLFGCKSAVFDEMK